MEVLFFVYNNLIMASYIICLFGFLMLYYKRRSDIYCYIGLIFLLFIFDNLIPYMNELLPGFNIQYQNLIANDPYLTNFIGFGIVLCYRLALLSFQKRNMNTWEEFSWIILLIVYFILSSLYPAFYSRLAMTIARRVISIAVFSAAYFNARKVPNDLHASVPKIRSRLLISLFLQIAASIEIMLPYFGLQLLFDGRIIFIEIIGLYFSVLGCIYIIQELIKTTTITEDVFSDSLQVSQTMEEDFCNNFPLTRREREVIKLVVDGLSNVEIAQSLVVTEGTAKTHVHNIYRKLGINNRLQLLRMLRDSEQKS